MPRGPWCDYGRYQRMPPKESVEELIPPGLESFSHFAQR
jgi:hypothetical protein